MARGEKRPGPCCTSPSGGDQPGTNHASCLVVSTTAAEQLHISARTAAHACSATRGRPEAPSVRREEQDASRTRREAAVSDTMQAVVCHGQKDYRMEEVPVPRPGRGEALVRVQAVGICASDL